VNDEAKRRPQRGGIVAWWRLIIPFALMGAVVTGWTGSVDVGSISVSDKLLHFVFYGVLTFAWIFALAPLRSRPLTVVAASFVLAVGWGLVDEALQAMTEHRTASALDAAADVLGAAVAAAIGLLLLGRSVGRLQSAARK
jgi:hypothetical protein